MSTGVYEQRRYANTGLTREHLVAWADDHGGAFTLSFQKGKAWGVAWRILDALHRRRLEET